MGGNGIKLYECEWDKAVWVGMRESCMGRNGIRLYG